MLSAYGAARDSFLRIFCADEEEAASIGRWEETAAKKGRQREGERQRLGVETLHTTASSLDVVHHPSAGLSAEEDAKAAEAGGAGGQYWPVWEGLRLVE